MMNGEALDHRLEALEQSFQGLRNQVDDLPAAREALAPALQEMAQALAAVRAAVDTGIGPDNSDVILRHVFEAIPDLLAVQDEDFNVILSNWHGHEHVPPAERRGQPKCYQVFFHRDRPCELCIVQEVFATGRPAKTEKIIPADGQVWEIHAFPILDNTGRPAMVAKHARNITALREAEKASQESEELYRVLAEGALAGVYLIQDDKFRYVNPVLSQIFGYDPDEIIGRLGPRDLIHPDERAFMDERLRRRLAGEVNEAHAHLLGLKRDGAIIHIETISRRVDYQGRPAVIGTLLDVTARVRAEAALAEREELYRVLTERSLAGVYLIQDGTFRYVNPVVAQMFGYTPEEMIGTTPRDTAYPDDLPLIEEQIRQRLTGAVEESHYTFRGLRRDGQVIHLESLGRRIDYKGKPAIIGTMLDITARLQSEEALLEAERQFRAIFDSATDGILIVDPETKRFRLANPRMAKMLGYTQAELQDLGVADIHPSESLHHVIDQLERQSKQEFAVALNIPVMRKDGSTFFADISASHFFIRGKLFLTGIFRDITARRRAEETLKMQALILENMAEAVHMVDKAGRIVFANPAAYAMFEYPVGELLGQDAAILNDLPHQESERFSREIRQCLQKEGRWSGEVRNRTKHGTPIITYARVSTLELPGKTLWIAVHEDITARKHLEMATEGYLQFIRNLMEAIPNPVFYKDTQGMILGCNKAFARDLQMPQEEISGKTVYDLFPAELARKCDEADAQALNYPDTLVRLEFQVPGPDGSLRHKVCQKAAFIQNSGRPAGVVSVTTDVTELMLAELALRESEERYRLLAENVHDVLWMMDTSYALTYVSPSVKNMTGYTPEEFLSLGLRQVVLPAYHQVFGTSLEKLLTPGAPLSLSYKVEFQRQDNSLGWAEITVTLLRDKHGDVMGLTGVARDITLRKRAEDALQESEARYRTLFETSPHGTVFMDLQMNILMANQRGLKNFGFDSLEEVSAKNGFEFIVPEDQPKVLAEMEKLFITGQSGIITVDLIRKDGSRLPCLLSSSLVRDAAGEPQAIIGVAQDVSKLQQAEAALRESEERYRTLFETSPNGTMLMDLDMNILMANQRGLLLLGFDSLEEVQTKNGVDFIAPEDQAYILPLIQGMFETGASRSADVNLLKKDGTRVPCLATASLVRDGAGEPQAIIVTAQDITDLKRAETALATHLQFMAVLLDAIPNPVFYKDVQGAYLGCNKAFASLMGISREEITGKTVYDLHPKELADQYYQKDLDLFQNPGNQAYETPLRSADGRLHQILANKATFLGPDGQVAGLVGNIVDISELRRAEEAVRESEERLRAIFEHAPVGITMQDPRGRFLQVNPAFQRIVGYNSQELRKLSCPQLTHPEDLPEQKRLHRELLTGKRQYYSIVKRYLRKDGEIVWVDMMIARLVNAQGETRAVGTVIDITARKQAEEALRQSEQRFRLMAETIQDVFWIVTPNIVRTLYVSPAYEQVWGRPREELYQSPRSFVEAIHPEDRAQVKAEIKECHTQGISWTREFRIVKPDGEVRWIQDRGFPVRNEDGRVVLFTGIATDITERKTLEQQLLLAQKMEAVGRLAGGVAHDFNNLLMAIMGYGEIMQAKVLKGDPLYEYLEDIMKATNRAGALTGQLLTFSRQQIVHPEVVDLNLVVADMERMLRRLIEEDIDLKIIAAPKLGAVMMDPGHLSQIIMNLVINARDAMPCGGRITIETAEVDLAESRQTKSGLVPAGAYVSLQVSDTGIGMDETVQAHIFEPFFTTKGPGKGTGLGLSTVYGIVKQSGGMIDLQSEVGQGSTFTLYLPRAGAPPQKQKAKVPQPTQLMGVETILLVEDEDVLRVLLAKFMRLHGYTVLEARHGGEALLLCERHQGPIHLMVTDVVMPQMSGRVLADKLIGVRPEMKVLYMSGYTEDEVVHRGATELSLAFLQKPFKAIDLLRQVHIILHTQASQ